MPAPIDYRLIFALMNGKVSNALRKRLNADFATADIEISGDQWDVLMAITQRDLCTQQDLCDATSYTKSTMTRIINDLEEKKIVERRKSRVDFRKNYITLTLKGRSVADQAQAISVRTLKESLHGLSKMDIIIAQQSLNAVLNNLTEKEKLLAEQISQEHHRRSEESRRVVRKMHANNTKLH